MKACFYLIWRELRAAGDSGQKAIVINAAVVAILWLLIAAVGAFMGTVPGRVLFGLYLIGGLGSGIIGGLAAAMALNKERDHRVLDSLLMSDLDAAGTLLLKASGAMAPAVRWSLAGLPMALWCVSYQRVSLLEVGLGLMLIWCTAGAITTIGMVAAAHGSTIGQCWRRVILFAVVFTVGPFIAPIFLAGTVPEPWRLLPFLSPLAAAYDLCRNAGLLACSGNCALLLAFSAGCLALGARLLQRTTQQHRRPTWRQRLRRCISQAMPRPRSLAAQNPVAWRDSHFLYGAGVAQYAVPLAVGAATWLLVVSVSAKGSTLWDMVGRTAVFVTVVLSAPAIMLSVVWAARAFAKEDEQRTFDALLLTTLTDREIVRGKLTALARALRPWCIGAILPLVVAMAYLGLRALGPYHFPEWDEPIEYLIWPIAIVALSLPWMLFETLVLSLEPEGRQFRRPNAPSVAVRRPTIITVCLIGLVLTVVFQGIWPLIAVPFIVPLAIAWRCQRRWRQAWALLRDDLRQIRLEASRRHAHEVKDSKPRAPQIVWCVITDFANRPHE